MKSDMKQLHAVLHYIIKIEKALKRDNLLKFLSQSASLCQPTLTAVYKKCNTMKESPELNEI
ncbi:UNVERIFIED_CONTAM: hypothetical protein NCL1_18326 [Trichonephila clavipes]